MMGQIVAMVASIGSAPVFTRTGLGIANDTSRSDQTAQARISGNSALQRPAGANAPVSARPVEPVSETSKPAKSGEQELTREEEEQVQDLKKRDTEVRAHERAHATAGGEFAGSPSFEFTPGPDGKRYATGGEVQIDSAPVRGDPQATIRKMDTVIRAALAPANPSSQDLQVARQAQQARTQARAELAEKRLQENSGEDGETSSILSLDQEEEQTAVQRLQAQTAYKGSGSDSANGADISAEIFAATNAISLFA